MSQHVSRTPGIAGLDHAVIAVRDLGAARETFTRMGFSLAPRGLHSTGSSNHNIMLGQDYFELLQVPQSNPLQAYYHEFLRRQEGLAALALTGTDLQAALPALTRAGFLPSTPLDFSRKVTSGSRTGTARFRLANLATDSTPGALLFICQHFTRELVWLPELQRHANGATGLAAVAFVAEKVAYLAGVYGRVFGAWPERIDEGATGLAAVAFVAEKVAYLAGVYGRVFGAWPERIDEGLKVETGSAPLAFCTRQSLQERLREVILPERAAPHAAALFIRVAERAVAGRVLREGGFSPKRMSDGSWAIDAPAAHGVAMVFG